MMFAVLAEDPSDAEVLVVLIRRISGDANRPIHRKGFGGCGELRRKAGRQIVNFARQGATHFVICHDSDGDDPADIRRSVTASLRGQITLTEHRHKIVVPVQELEAWMIADEQAISAVIPSLLTAEVKHPESLENPKEWLINSSRKGRSRPLYVPHVFNEKVAGYLNIDKAGKKCPSFLELVGFVRESA